MIGSNRRRKILLGLNQHTIVVHGITQLALFGNGLLILRGLSMVMFSRFNNVLVSIYHQLTRCKADEHDPGVNDMLLALFQNTKTRYCNNNALFGKNSQTHL